VPRPVIILPGYIKIVRKIIKTKVENRVKDNLLPLLEEYHAFGNKFGDGGDTPMRN
jgi:hypothetical protein